MRPGLNLPDLSKFDFAPPPTLPPVAASTLPPFSPAGVAQAGPLVAPAAVDAFSGRLRQRNEPSKKRGEAPAGEVGEASTQGRKKARVPRQQNVDMDHFERLNYMHQLSLLAFPIHAGLARYYLREMRAVSRRTVIRLGAAVRGTYCRKCLRMAAVSRHQTLKTGKRCSFVLSRCVRCGFAKRFVHKTKKRIKLY